MLYHQNSCKINTTVMLKTSSLKIFLWSIGIVSVLLIGFMLYQFTVPGRANSGLVTVAMLMAGLILGGLISFLAARRVTTQPVVKESSHTVVESIRKVFKVVSAEGHFNEIYNYEEASKMLFNLIPTKKKALVIVQAKVLIGYDFEKLKWEADEETRKIRLVDFPEPEILSTETDYKYYNIEENLFNLFSKDDLARIQQNGKLQVIEAAKNSKLPQVAAEQMRMLLTEMVQSKNWVLENASEIAVKPKSIAAPVGETS